MLNDYYSLPHDLYEDILRHPESYLRYYTHSGRQCAKHLDSSENSPSLKIDKKVFEDIRRQLHNILDAKPLQGNFGGSSLYDFIVPHLHNKYLLKFDIVKCFNSVTYEQLEKAAGVNLTDPAMVKSFYFRPNLLVGMAASSVIAEIVLIKVVDNFLNSLLHSENYRTKGVTYTRFYDDIYLSANDKGLLVDIQPLLATQLDENGFQVDGKKSSLSKMENATILKSRINHGQISVGKKFKNNLRLQMHRYHPDASDMRSLETTIQELYGLIGKISHILRTETNPSERWIVLQDGYIRDLEEYHAMYEQILFENG